VVNIIKFLLGYIVMKKTVFLLVLILITSSCSFVIGSHPSTPGSTHIPSINTGRPVFPTLKGTIWKLDNNSTEQDRYLYIDEYEDKYAIGYERKGVRPEKYPAYYEYTALGREQDIPSASPLKFYDTVIFNEDDNDKNFIGFHLENSFLLYSAESTINITTIIESLESGTGGDVWKLYNYY